MLDLENKTTFEGCVVYDDSETRKGLYARLRVVWFTRVLKLTRNSSWKLSDLRAARFTRGLNSTFA